MIAANTLLDALSREVYEMHQVTWDSGETLNVFVKRKNKDARVKELENSYSEYYKRPFIVRDVKLLETKYTFWTRLVSTS
jgi:hypothetical protein